MGMRPASPALVLEEGQDEVLEALARSVASPHREVVRAKAVLMAAAGLANTAIASQLKVSPASVGASRERFAAEPLARFAQLRSGRGRKPQLPKETIVAIVRLTLETKPEGRTHWSCRSMAKISGISPPTVQWIWCSRGLKPHLVETFKMSNDKRFEGKLVDVVGLYRTQSSLPMNKGRAGTMTHDYKRNGTTTLFAALDVLTGKGFGQCLPRHTNREFLRFLRQLDREVPNGLAVHLILDNYGTHGHDDVDAWLAKHPRSTSTSHRPPARG